MDEIYAAASGFDLNFPEYDALVADRSTRPLFYAVESEDLEYLAHRIEHRRNYHRPSDAQWGAAGWLTDLD